MRTIICGGRDYAFTEDDFAWLDGLRESLPITEVVHGGAPGADRWGAKWALKRKIPVSVFTAEWRTLGKIAGPIRNDRMAKYAEACIAFPGGRGTAGMIAMATERGLKVIRR